MVSRSQRLCRLCEFPAADGGVPLDALDADKWAAWCRRELGEELHISSDAERVSVICQYCIWEARLVQESSIHNCYGMNNTDDGCDWWTGHDNDHFFREHFYKRSLIQPCKVVLEKISGGGLGNIDVNDNCPRNRARLEDNIQVCQASPRVENQSNNLSPKATFKIFHCSLCLKIYQNRNSLGIHMSKTHKNAFKCKSYHCGKYFLNEDERRQHEEKFHLNGEQVKCHFCGALISNICGCLNIHIKTQHKEAIKCDYNKNCPKFFHTESEKTDHIFNEHTQGLQLKFIPRKCIYCDKILKNKNCLKSHVNKFHMDLKIKCRVKGCVVYFLSQKESEEHFLQMHQHAENLKKWQCPKCSYKSNNKYAVRDHLQSVHSNKASMKSTLKCLLCPKSFIEKHNLKEHLKRIHGALSISLWQPIKGVSAPWYQRGKGATASGYARKGVTTPSDILQEEQKTDYVAVCAVYTYDIDYQHFP